jgi:anti-anti-sigma factor
MILQETLTDNTLTIRIMGNIDNNMLLSFKERVISTLINNPVDLVLDLHGVNNINSSTLGILLRLHKHQKSAGRKLSIINPARHIEDLLKFSSLSQSIA